MWNSCVQMWERLQRTDVMWKQTQSEKLTSPPLSVITFRNKFPSHLKRRRSGNHGNAESSEIWKSASVSKWVKRNHRVLRIWNEQQRERRRQQLAMMSQQRPCDRWRHRSSFRNFLRLLRPFSRTAEIRVFLFPNPVITRCGMEHVFRV